jgi:hypothetical protein
MKFPSGARRTQTPWQFAMQMRYARVGRENQDVTIPQARIHCVGGAQEQAVAQLTSLVEPLIAMRAKNGLPCAKSAMVRRGKFMPELEWMLLNTKWQPFGDRCLERVFVGAQPAGQRLRAQAATVERDAFNDGIDRPTGLQAKPVDGQPRDAGQQRGAVEVDANINDGSAGGADFGDTAGEHV